jgi:hypothetical protein
MTFDDLDFEIVPSPSYGFEMFGNLPNGIKSSHHFDNGYGIFVVRTTGSYGWENGLFEVSILKQRENQWEVCYDTPISSGVIGNCTIEKINQILKNIENLPKFENKK